MGNKVSINTQIQCYHCGDDCNIKVVQYDEKQFCCSGCKSVYEILQQNNLCNYYSITQSPGKSQSKSAIPAYFDFLDEKETQEKLIHFKNKTQSHINLSIPNMHCSSCIWLLENLFRLHKGIASSRVHFLKKELKIVFEHDEISLKELIVLLKKIGYEPNLSVNDLQADNIKIVNRKQLYKIGIAGFCFGNIMMLSLPDYFSNGNFFKEPFLNNAFNYTALMLSLPVLFFCAKEFFVSSYQIIKQKQINIDVPIAFAILVAFLVSVFQIIISERMGYLDSMSGIVFFMLLGRFFQNRTYNQLTFQKNISSYLPLSVNIIEENIEKNISLQRIKIGDEIIVRHQEIVPTDSILLNESAWFDYSFVTGESAWVQKFQHEVIYAGAIQKSANSNMTISKKPSQSYITDLWNSNQANKFQLNNIQKTEKINLYFSAIVLILGITACMYWMFQNQYQLAFSSLITVWIVACPCALLLSSTFTNGNFLMLLSQNGLYVKNAAALEMLSKVNTFVFDKTGTLTKANQSHIDFVGKDLNRDEWNMIYTLSYQSIHPLSKAIKNYIQNTNMLFIENYKSYDGKGIEVDIDGKNVKLGSSNWLQVQENSNNHFTKVFVQIADEVLGYFEIKNEYRKNIFSVLTTLKSKYKLVLLSGDNDAEKKNLEKIFTEKDGLQFNCMPEQKTNAIREMQSQGNITMMIGDGLNDALAFEKSNIGMAVVEDDNHFLPSCDVILKAEKLSSLPSLMHFLKYANTILIICFVVSIVYNIIGLSFAMQGKLAPVVAAILMPLSTVSIVALSYFLSRYFAKRHQLNI